MAAWNAAALLIADAEWDLAHCEYLRASGSPLYRPAAHERAEAALLSLLLDVREALDARLLQLRPPAPAACGDVMPPLPPPPEPGGTPAGRVSESVHG
jgi:hypothetical protein